MGQASRRIINRFSCDNFAKNALLAVEAALTGSPVRKTNVTRAAPEQFSFFQDFQAFALCTTFT